MNVDEATQAGYKLLAAFGGLGAMFVMIRVLIHYMRELNKAYIEDNSDLRKRIDDLEERNEVLEVKVYACELEKLEHARLLNSTRIDHANQVYELKVRYSALRSHVIRLYPEFLLELEKEERDAARMNPNQEGKP